MFRDLYLDVQSRLYQLAEMRVVKSTRRRRNRLRQTQAENLLNDKTRDELARVRDRRSVKRSTRDIACRSTSDRAREMICSLRNRLTLTTLWRSTTIVGGVKSG